MMMQNEAALLDLLGGKGASAVAGLAHGSLDVGQLQPLEIVGDDIVVEMEKEAGHNGQSITAADPKY
jgi:uncharacterized ParB-like nuclease family protein